jgi:hypothetical protein
LLGRPLRRAKDKELLFLNNKRRFFSAVFFQFLVIKILEPDPDSMNPDPQHCFEDLDAISVGRENSPRTWKYHIEAICE